MFSFWAALEGGTTEFLSKFDAVLTLVDPNLDYNPTNG
jgi:hypothetical protein